MDTKIPKLIRITTARQRLPLGKTRFYQLIKAGVLPPIVKLPGGGRAAFMDEEALNSIITKMVEGPAPREE